MNLKLAMFRLLHWVALCVLALGVIKPAMAQPGKLQTLWQISYAPPEYSLDTRASMVGADGRLTVLCLQRPLKSGKDRSRDRGWIGVFGDNGAVQEQFSFSLRDGEDAVAEIDAFAAAADGGYVVAGLSLDNESWIVHVARGGTTRALKSLGRARVAFILATPDGSFVLGGRTGRDLFAAQLRPDGELVWERKLDRGFDDIFLAGVASSGGVLMLEHSGVREQFFMRDTVLGLTRLTATDSSIRTPSFTQPGRAGAIAASSAGLGVLVDTGAGVKQVLSFLRIDFDMKLAKPAREILNINFALERARIAALTADEFLVLAIDGGKLIALQLAPDGSTTARWDSEGGRVFLHPDVQARGNVAYLVASELKTRDDERGARSMVYAARVMASPR